MAKRQMVINYVPGEECRVAIVEDGKLSDFHAERMDSAGHVGNIYVGRVVNVEQGIQAAFVDFGLEANGFLHISDVHPQYFPGEDEETTERVGKKTPRRDRPPIQQCFRRGDEVIVQVLKEGVGTKGPTVTSYLSIPGRFLVMMPNMDRVGVSRKVEDEETRRKMREILDQLDLPEGFGFILRTAGMERTKTELKRDLAYLQRLWKDMEKRRKTGGNKPKLLYAESDLLVRALRDMLASDIDRVVIDNEAAINRAARFLKIISPRSSTKLVHYKGGAPVFHVTGIEEQIQRIHAREVPLPSGGRLVIDETEALVAIDVNSGKMRDAKDAETTAFRTNMEAVDEICRQLRLRDLGGVVVNDLIDMRFAKHRREIENRFKENLKQDRARWTTAPISEFGILEMTRQRMRGSHESQHFAECPVCRGRGLVQRPDSVAADGLRELSAILDAERVARVEMVVHPRIAGELLSTKRKSLSRIERTSGKRVDVRVSDTIPVDRLTFYAYDERGADIDTAKLGRRKVRDDEMEEFQYAGGDDWAVDADQEAAAAEVAEAPEPEAEAELAPHPIEIEPGENGAAGEQDRGEERDGRGRRRRRRGGRGRGRAGEDRPAAGEPAARPDARGPAAGRRPQPQAAPALGAEPAETRPPGASLNGAGSAEGEEGEGGRRRRRRRRRRGRGDEAPAGAPRTGEPPQQDADSAPEDQGPSNEDDWGSDLPSGVRAAEPVEETEEAETASPEGHSDAEPNTEGERTGRRRRRRRGGRGRGDRQGELNETGAPTGAPDTVPTEPPQTDAEAPESDTDEQDPPPRGESATEGGEPRRRRRRRRRGGRGGAEGGQPPSGDEGQAPQQVREPRQGGNGRREGRPSGPAQGQPARSTPPPATRPAPAAPAPAPAPKPRTLYSSRRRLGPAERRDGGREE